MEEKKSLTKKFEKPTIKRPKKFFLILGSAVGLIILCFVFYLIFKGGPSFLPLQFFQKDKTKEQPSGLPPTPKGRVAPSPEFLEKIKEEQGKTPSGTEFKGPTSPPPSNFDPKKPPTISNFKITPVTCAADCDSCPYPLNPALSWNFTDPGDSQTAFQIQIAQNSSFKNPLDSGKIESSQGQCGIPDGCKLPGILSFNKNYWLRIKVWDSQNIESGWTNYSGSYKTPIHMYPSLGFEWSPQTPQIGKEAQFTDLSKSYGGTDGETKIGKAIKSRVWNFQDGNPPFSNEQNPKIIFEKTPGEKTVSLTITDKDGLQCNISKNITVVLPLPKFK